MAVKDRHISVAYVYGIVGHAVPDDRAVPDGIELYTKELVKIRFELENLHNKTSSETINEYGLATNREFDNVFSMIWYLLWNYEEVLKELEKLQEIESEFQTILDRISNARRGMVMGRVSEVESISGDDYTQSATEPVMTDLLHDGTFSREMEKLDSATNRVDQRLTGIRETANARVSLTTSITTVLITVLLLVLAILSFSVTLASFLL